MCSAIDIVKKFFWYYISFDIQLQFSLAKKSNYQQFLILKLLYLCLHFYTDILKGIIYYVRFIFNAFSKASLVQIIFCSLNRLFSLIDILTIHSKNVNFSLFSIIIRLLFLFYQLPILLIQNNQLKRNRPILRIFVSMFSNTYQSGYFLQVWDSRVNPQKNPLYKQLFKTVPSSNKNFYDKQVKSFIYELQGNQKLIFPSDDRQQLGLHQRYIVLQLYIPLGGNWTLELAINDLTATKKRINITTQAGKQELKYFSFRYPLENGTIQKGIWSFLAIDVYSFCNAFKNTVFRSLDNVMISGSCKVRRLFTMKEWIEFQIPKNYWLSPSISQTMQLIQYKQPSTKEINSHMQSVNLNRDMISSSVNGQYTKLMSQSKVIGDNNSPILLRHSQKQSPTQQKNSKAKLKLPAVALSKLNKDSTPLKASKLPQLNNSIIRETNNKQYGVSMIDKSNRSLAKANLIIQRSKIRLNSLQQKEEKILNRLKSQQNRFTQKAIYQSNPSYSQKQKTQKPQDKAVFNKDNIFKSDIPITKDLKYSQISETINNANGHNNNYNKDQSLGISPKLLKMKKKFQEDNIFQMREESYSSSYSRQSVNDQTLYQRNKKFHQNSNLDNSQQGSRSTIMPSSNSQVYRNSQVANFGKKNRQRKYDTTEGISLQNQNNESHHKNHKQSRLSQIIAKGNKQRQQIIQQDLWTDDQGQRIQKPQTPIQQMIQSYPNVIQPPSPTIPTTHVPRSSVNQTIITKQNNKQVIMKQNINSLSSHPNSQLELIYDEMIGCYYHPETNTYYEIKN